MKRTPIACTAAALLVLGVCWHPAAALPPGARDLKEIPGAQTVTGTVNYKERTPLPQTAMIRVELIDVSEKNHGKAVLGEDNVWPAGVDPPIPFRIAYDPSRIDPTRTYAVRALITDGEKTLYSSAMSYVLTRGAPAKVDIEALPASTLRRQPVPGY